jgi:DNA-binding transcriptional regulator PaaX
LPTELLPDNWIGDTAYALFRENYCKMGTAVDQYYRQMIAHTGDELLMHQGRQYTNRFNSLDDCSG